MDAIKGNINSILNGYKQFIIPVYQRTYSWRIEQCQRLWNDIVNMQSKNRTGHFVGSIVNIAEQAMPTGVQKFMIIDGQQRMTTLTILLIALRDFAEENIEVSTINPNAINGMCIKNDYSEGLDKYKMLLTQTDREVLINLIEKRPLDTTKNSRLVENYNFFLSKIKSGEIDEKEILDGISKLQIVNITLDRAVDDAQLIFESLNSTGLDLSESDLIRNYILMGLEPDIQNEVYENYWLPMEKLFDYENQLYFMDKFFRDYLTLKKGKIPKLNKIYESFKVYHQEEEGVDINYFCRDLYKLAKYYTNILFARSGDKDLDLIFNDIKSLQMEVSFPFLLKIYNDYQNSLITKDDLIQILRLCESYVFRRAICGIPTNSLNKTFMVICNNVKEDNYLNSVKAFFLLQDSYKEFPTDENFEESFAEKDIYNMRIRNYILGKLENYSNKAPINIESYTIEHIMPQNKNLIGEWRNALGVNWEEVQKKYIHTIGNLTLTAYNSEMSDKAFNEKQDMPGGFKESALRINSYVVKQNTWNEDTIKERARLLCNIAKKIWVYPSLNESEFNKFTTKTEEETYTLESYEYLNGDIKVLFEALDKRIFNLFTDVRRECTKLYIAYKAYTNFVDVVPQKSKIRLAINMKFTEVDDVKHICHDTTDKGRWGNGDVEVNYDSLDQLDNIMEIIKQSYNKQVE